MIVYLDVSCLNRPFDDQSQARIRLEAEAVLFILERIDQGEWQQATSQVVTLETDAIADKERRRKLRALVQQPEVFVRLTEETYQRAGDLQALGLKPADALHVAAAESGRADVFLTCDDRLLRAAKRSRTKLHVRVANPVDWLKEIGDAANPG
jgi:predicted nucleic acid-binding protein